MRLPDQRPGVRMALQRSSRQNRQQMQLKQGQLRLRKRGLAGATAAGSGAHLESVVLERQCGVELLARRRKARLVLAQLL